MANSIIQSIIQSYKTCCMRWKQFLQIAFIDLLFLILGGYALTKLMEKIAQHLVAINMVNAEVADLMSHDALALQDISLLTSQQTVFQTLYGKIVTLLFLQGTIFFVLWTVIEGYGWYKTYTLAKAKTRTITLRQYYGRFALVTLLFLILFAGGVAIFSNAATANDLQSMRLFGTPALTMLFAVLFVVLGYFWFVGMILVPYYPPVSLGKNMFTEGVMGAKRFFPLFLLIAIKGVIIYKLFVWLSQQYIIGTLVYIVLVIPLYLAWAKVATAETKM